MRTILSGLVLASFAAGCASPARSPAAAVEALSDAAGDGDLDGVLQLLGPRTRARLTLDARRTGEQAGRRELRPRELLATGWTPPRFRVTRTHEIARDADHAVVEAIGRHGEHERVDLVREPDGWKIELP